MEQKGNDFVEMEDPEICDALLVTQNLIDLFEGFLNLKHSVLFNSRMWSKQIDKILLWILGLLALNLFLKH